jgi:hypothetical protein
MPVAQPLRVPWRAEQAHLLEIVEVKIAIAETNPP